MHVPEGYFRFTTGPDVFIEELRRLGGEDDVRQWLVISEPCLSRMTCDEYLRKGFTLSFGVCVIVVFGER